MIGYLMVPSYQLKLYWLITTNKILRNTLYQIFLGNNLVFWAQNVFKSHIFKKRVTYAMGGRVLVTANLGLTRLHFSPIVAYLPGGVGMYLAIQGMEKWISSSTVTSPDSKDAWIDIDLTSIWCKLSLLSGMLYPLALTHWGWVTHICVNKLNHHWFR